MDLLVIVVVYAAITFVTRLFSSFVAVHKTQGQILQETKTKKKKGVLQILNIST